MPKSLHLVLAAGFAAMVLFAHSPAEAKSGKYEFMKATADRVWRLNTETGEITVCTLRGENLVCTVSSDAAMPPKKSYSEMKADSQKQRRQQQDKEMRIIDRMLSFFRELITMSREESGSN